MNSSNHDGQKSRRRGITSLTLGWLAERLRRAEKIKEQLQKGTYKVDSSKVAQSIANKD